MKYSDPDSHYPQSRILNLIYVLTIFFTFLNSFEFVLRGTNWLELSILMGVLWDGLPSVTH